MTNRREFLTQTTAAGALVAAGAGVTSMGAAATGPHSPIKSVIRRPETTLRLGGDGDNWHMSWAADDRQYLALCDGMGFPAKPTEAYNARVLAISGGPQDAKFHDLPGFPDKSLYGMSHNHETPYYPFGTLALDGRIYQFMCAFFTAVKIVYSPDNGRTWCNQDGSTPVVWEPRERFSHENMVFLKEPQQAFSLLTVLQMGRNYEHNKDGFVYIYAPNGTLEGTMNQLVLARVPKSGILNRRAYEFFAGMNAKGKATWAKDIDKRAIVHTFPQGWVNKAAHPYAWHPSVVYNAPLGLYLMANWGMGTVTAESNMFEKPSYLGFWTAPNPWGPWTQIHEETAWLPTNDPAERAYQPQIAPKWIAPDGKSFWLVWTDFQRRSDADAINPHTAEDHDEFMRRWLQLRRYMPYYAFNAQRVDLNVG